MKTFDFAGDVDILTRAALRKRDITTLAESIGCRVLRVSGGAWCIQELMQTEPSQEAVVENALLAALRSGIVIESVTVGETFSLLDGFSKNDRWRNCLLTIDDAYDFACTLLKFSLQTGLHGYVKGTLPTTIAMTMVPTLNAWLRPVLPFESQPSLEVMVDAMFGGAWRHLIGPDEVGNGNIILLVKAQRPPFLPGLVPAQIDVELDLPRMEFSQQT